MVVTEHRVRIVGEVGNVLEIVGALVFGSIVGFAAAWWARGRWDVSSLALLPDELLDRMAAELPAAYNRHTFTTPGNGQPPATPDMMRPPTAPPIPARPAGPPGPPPTTTAHVVISARPPHPPSRLDP